MKRRNVIAACGTAVSGVIAGCSDQQNEDEDNSHGSPSTSTEQPATETPTGNAGTDDEIETARAELRRALRRIDGMEVIVDGEIGIVTETKFSEAADTDEDDVLRPIKSAEKELKSVSSEGDSQEANHVETLLEVATYAELKYRKHVSLALTFSNLERSIDALDSVTGQDSMTYIESGQEQLADTADYLVDAEERLARIEDRPTSPEVSNFEPAREREELDYIASLLFRWDVGFDGLELAADGIKRYDDTMRMILDENYEIGERNAISTRETFEDSNEYLQETLDRDAEIFTEDIQLYRCMTAGFNEAADILVSAAQTGNEGDKDHAEELVVEAQEHQEEVINGCE